MGITPKFTPEKVAEHTKAYFEKRVAQIVSVCNYVGESATKSARQLTKEQGGFGDRTGNLRSSIGYTVADRGKVVTTNTAQSSSGTDKTTGEQKAKELLGKSQPMSDIRLHMVAGMDYGVEVESKGKNVISIQSIQAEIDLKSILGRLR